jgi:hypothetical protein
MPILSITLSEAKRGGLVGHIDGPPSVVPTYTACYGAGWRPPGFVRLSG